MKERLRLAYFSPLPPERTGIADYSAELLPPLAQLAQLTVYTDGPVDSVESIAGRICQVRPLAVYPAHRWQHDLALYQIGNSMYHDAVYRMLRRYPGVVVLHDYVLHLFIATRTAGQGKFWSYLRENGYSLGVAGIRRAREMVQQQMSPWEHLEVPLNDRLLDLSLGLIVHSEFARRQVEMRAPDLPVGVVPALITPPARPLAPKQIPGWPPDSVVFLSAGQVTQAKGLNQALRAFARLHKTLPQVRYLIVGESLPDGFDLQACIAELGLRDVVWQTGYIEDINEMNAWVAAGNIAVNLRNPTAGETSATALRALAAGLPVIVHDHGWYAELPEDVSRKVPPGNDDALLAAMQELAEDAALRRRMGEQAARYAAEQHSPARAAQAYIQFLEQVLTGLEHRLLRSDAV